MGFANIVGMMANMHRSAVRRNQSLAQLERDAALGRVARTRRWVSAGAAALTAGFAALVSSVAPGRTLSARGSVRAPATRASVVASTQMPPLASPSSLGLQGPSQAPQTDSTQAPANQAQSAPAPSPTPQASSGGGGVVSGGS
jgi:hypothetical protein